MIALDRDWLADHSLPLPGADTDKNKRGRVLAAGGSEAVPGGLLLTAEAALRSGAGKVQVATVERAALPLGIRMPEAAVYGLPTNPKGELASDAGNVIAAMLDRCDTLILGPGMGPDADGGEILRAVLADPAAIGSVLLDAGMIAEAAGNEVAVRGWQGRFVMTPHPGEMAALMGCDERRVSPELAQEAAERFDATIVLKTPRTWIASPGQTVLEYPGGGSGLATGGSGDVLAGIIGGLMARGAAAQVACAWGVWLHGEAGRRLGEEIGELGFLAREILPHIPRLLGLHQLGVSTDSNCRIEATRFGSTPVA
ncbi:MAG: NAD(P)H-hydrate dehydratase [Pseudomonadota bacterium]